MPRERMTQLSRTAVIPQLALGNDRKGEEPALPMEGNFRGALAGNGKALRTFRNQIHPGGTGRSNAQGGGASAAGFAAKIPGSNRGDDPHGNGQGSAAAGRTDGQRPLKIGRERLLRASLAGGHPIQPLPTFL